MKVKKIINICKTYFNTLLIKSLIKNSHNYYLDIISGSNSNNM